MKSAVLSQSLLDPQKPINFIAFTDTLQLEIKALVDSFARIPGIVNTTVEIRYYKTGVINDLLGQTFNPTSSDHYFH